MSDDPIFDIFKPVAYLSTDGGPHPAEKWGRVLADQVVVVNPLVTSNYLRAMGMDLHAAIASAAERVIAGIQEHERAALENEGGSRLTRELNDVLPQVEMLVSDLSYEASRGIFAAHFSAPHVQVYLNHLAIKTLSTVLWIERSWYADRHPETEEAKAFRARWIG